MHRLRTVDTVALEEEIVDDFSTLPSVKEQTEDGKHQGENEYIEKLAEHAFTRPHRGETDKLVVRRGTTGIAIFFALCVTVLAAVGCFLPSCSSC